VSMEWRCVGRNEKYQFPLDNPKSLKEWARWEGRA
jgi:hypothetical protein